MVKFSLLVDKLGLVLLSRKGAPFGVTDGRFQPSGSLADRRGHGSRPGMRPAGLTSWTRCNSPWRGGLRGGLGSRTEVVDEPVACERGDSLEGAWLLEQVGRAGHDGEAALAPQ